MKQVLFLQDKEYLLRIVFEGAPSWDNFESLALFLEQYYSANIYDKADGPDARAWKMYVDGIQTALFHDDMYGNYMEAQSIAEADLIQKIGLDVEKRLNSR